MLDRLACDSRSVTPPPRIRSLSAKRRVAMSVRKRDGARALDGWAKDRIWTPPRLQTRRLAR